MNKPAMTFAEGLRLSWKRELEIGDPKRITRLVFATVYYGAIHFLFFVLPNAWIAIGKRLMK